MTIAKFMDRLNNIQLQILNGEFDTAHSELDVLLRTLNGTTVEPELVHLLDQAKAHLEGIQSIVDKARRLKC